MNFPYKLGKKPAVFDVRTLHLKSYLIPSQLPPIRRWVKWSPAVKGEWQMLANDRVGDCTCASAGHLIHTWTASAHAETTVTEQDVLSAYSAITGYNPADPSTDNGAVELDVLKYWQHTGVGGHRIGAYASLTMFPQLDLKDLQYAVYLFGGAYIGLALPLAIQGATEWIYPNHTFPNLHPAWRPGSWGGHAVPVIDYDLSTDRYTCVTWGGLLQMNGAFLTNYCEEAYAIISDDYVTREKFSPAGFDINALQKDLQAVKS